MKSRFSDAQFRVAAAEWDELLASAETLVSASA
jgi:hypothetical protein